QGQPRRILGSQDNLTALGVTRFVEKPDLATAKRYVRSGKFYWNSGIFIWRVDAILKEMEKYMPVLYASLAKLGAAIDTPDVACAIKEFYRDTESISIDYGVLQKSRRAAVIQAPFKWSDIGNWSSLGDVAEKDEHGNIRIGAILDIDSRD